MHSSSHIYIYFKRKISRRKKQETKLSHPREVGHRLIGEKMRGKNR